MLAPKMDGMEERLERITDAKAKIKAEADWNRFKELEPVCCKLNEVQEALDTAREERDSVQAKLLEIEGALARSKTEERRLADNITDDHIIACEKGTNVAHIFPNIQSNYVLYSLNMTYVAFLSYLALALALLPYFSILISLALSLALSLSLAITRILTTSPTLFSLYPT